MTTNKNQRISIGFAGGQVLSARVPTAELTSLQKALSAREGWHEIPSEDGDVSLDLAQVVYLRVDSDEPRVGFGA